MLPVFFKVYAGSLNTLVFSRPRPPHLGVSQARVAANVSWRKKRRSAAISVGSANVLRFFCVTLCAFRVVYGNFLSVPVWMIFFNISRALLKGL